ncbi:pentatricopeptide repeat-containing protein At2g30780 [Phalaenopsis equestris]|uniref:pentatricopeptide repeat-containing protein At2g30780 n=1 Tax=Phalaenopsis equestris TaxID=78828 RepID=UPI0009E2F20E|nr:pentatricopeptide repeat-containing protein At2g30780 [Phalaenopsis equestris]
MANLRHLQILRRCFVRNSFPRLHLAPHLIRRPKIINPATVRYCRRYSSCSSDDITDLRERILLLTEKPTSVTQDGDVDDIRSQVSSLADELLAAGHLANLEDDDDLTDLAAFLDSRSAVSLLRHSPSGLAFVELLSRLKTRPRLAVQVFLWRLKLADAGVQLVPEEYAKAISLAGRSNKADLAGDLFTDAGRRGIRSTGMYNSLMAAYMYNCLASKAISVFEDLTRDPACEPTIVTYNILLSVYGRLMLIDKLENLLKQIHEHPHISPNLSTYNILMAAYLTAWMWDRMENTYKGMIRGHVKPDTFTHFLMLRGYAHAGNVEKMEETYELVKDMVNRSVSPLVRAMICAYCKSSVKNRVSKIEELTKHIPEGEYRPWLNVLMIRLYAQEGLLDAMEKFISEAVNREVRVIAIGVMRSIISSYFRCDSIDRLIKFIRLAECAGWKLCRSLYHCKMVMYGQRNQIDGMHGALQEMEHFRFDRTKKTFLIMYKAYSKAGRRSEAEIVVGMMCKNGFLDPKAALLF